MDPLHAFAIALILLTLCVLVFRLRPKKSASAWVSRALWGIGIVPGFLAVVTGAVFVFGRESDTGWPIFSAGILLQTAAQQLFFEVKQQAARPEPA